MTNFRKNKAFLRIACLFVTISFLSSAIMPGYARAQDLILPAPTQFVNLSNSYSFPVLKGLKFDPATPFNMQFIIDTADQKDIDKEEASRLIKYFFAGLTIPEKDTWVNMSSYEKDRIIPSSLADTDLGKDLLSLDYILKQVSVSLTYPESEIGKDFWSKTYVAVLNIAHTTNLPINTFNKIWIMPDKAEVYEHENFALVHQATLKTMLEEDYIALKNGISDIQKQKKNMKEELITKINQASSNVMREFILPKINKDVNSGKNFATLRQIYYALILGVWFKKKFKDSIYKYYINQGKVKGIDINDKDAKDKIYNLYIEGLKKGLYNYIKSDYDPGSRRNIKRQYFSGGFTAMNLASSAIITPASEIAMRTDFPAPGSGRLLSITASPLGVEKPGISGSPEQTKSASPVKFLGKDKEEQIKLLDSALKLVSEKELYFEKTKEIPFSERWLASKLRHIKNVINLLKSEIEVGKSPSELNSEWYFYDWVEKLDKIKSYFLNDPGSYFRNNPKEYPNSSVRGILYAAMNYVQKAEKTVSTDKTETAGSPDKAKSASPIEVFQSPLPEFSEIHKKAKTIINGKVLEIYKFVYGDQPTKQHNKEIITIGENEREEIYELLTAGILLEASFADINNYYNKGYDKKMKSQVDFEDKWLRPHIKKIERKFLLGMDSEKLRRVVIIASNSLTQAWDEYSVASPEQTESASPILKHDLKIIVTEDEPARSNRHDTFAYLYLDPQDARRLFDSLKEKVSEMPDVLLASFNDYFVLCSFAAPSGFQKKPRVIPLAVVAHKETGLGGDQVLMLNLTESIFAESLLYEWMDTTPMISGKSLNINILKLKDNLVAYADNLYLAGDKVEYRKFVSPFTGDTNTRYPYIPGNIEITIKERPRAGSPIADKTLIIESIKTIGDKNAFFFELGYYENNKPVNVPPGIVEFAQQELKRILKNNKNLFGEVSTDTQNLFITLESDDSNLARKLGFSIIDSCREKLSEGAGSPMQFYSQKEAKSWVKTNFRGPEGMGNFPLSLFYPMKEKDFKQIEELAISIIQDIPKEIVHIKRFFPQVAHRYPSWSPPTEKSDSEFHWKITNKDGKSFTGVLYEKGPDETIIAILTYIASTDAIASLSSVKSEWSGRKEAITIFTKKTVLDTEAHFEYNLEEFWKEKYLQYKSNSLTDSERAFFKKYFSSAAGSRPSPQNKGSGEGVPSAVEGPEQTKSASPIVLAKFTDELGEAASVQMRDEFIKGKTDIEIYVNNKYLATLSYKDDKVLITRYPYKSWLIGKWSYKDLMWADAPELIITESGNELHFTFRLDSNFGRQNVGNRKFEVRLKTAGSPLNTVGNILPVLTSEAEEMITHAGSPLAFKSHEEFKVALDGFSRGLDKEIERSAEKHYDNLKKSLDNQEIAYLVRQIRRALVGDALKLLENLSTDQDKIQVRLPISYTGTVDYKKIFGKIKNSHIFYIGEDGKASELLELALEKLSLGPEITAKVSAELGRIAVEEKILNKIEMKTKEETVAIPPFALESQIKYLINRSSFPWHWENRKSALIDLERFVKNHITELSIGQQIKIIEHIRNVAQETDSKELKRTASECLNEIKPITVEAEKLKSANDVTVADLISHFLSPWDLPIRRLAIKNLFTFVEKHKQELTDGQVEKIREHIQAVKEESDSKTLRETAAYYLEQLDSMGLNIAGSPISKKEGIQRIYELDIEIAKLRSEIETREREIVTPGYIMTSMREHESSVVVNALSKKLKDLEHEKENLVLMFGEPELSSDLKREIEVASLKGQLKVYEYIAIAGYYMNFMRDDASRESEVIRKKINQLEAKQEQAGSPMQSRWLLANPLIPKSNEKIEDVLRQLLNDPLTNEMHLAVNVSEHTVGFVKVSSGDIPGKGRLNLSSDTEYKYDEGSSIVYLVNTFGESFSITSGGRKESVVEIIAKREASSPMSPKEKAGARLLEKLQELKKNSGLPILLTPPQLPEVTSNNQLWAEALRALHFDSPVYRRVERETKTEERYTGTTAFRDANEDKDIKELTVYDVSKPELYSIRKGEDVRGFILQPDASIPPEAYFMHRGVFTSREDIQKAFYENKIRFDITVIPPAMWGVDFAKTVGHYHDPVEKPEIYQVVSGEVLWLMQKTDEEGNVLDFITVRAKAGDIAIMLPGYGHVSVNLSETEPLVMANWLTWHQSSYYGSFKKNKGAAYYVIVQDDGTPALVPNPKYTKSLSSPRQMAAKDEVTVFGLKRGEPIYNLLKHANFAKEVEFLNLPQEYTEFLTPEGTLDEVSLKEQIKVLPTSAAISSPSEKEAPKEKLTWTQVRGDLYNLGTSLEGWKKNLAGLQKRQKELEVELRQVQELKALSPEDRGRKEAVIKDMVHISERINTLQWLIHEHEHASSPMTNAESEIDPSLRDLRMRNDNSEAGAPYGGIDLGNIDVAASPNSIPVNMPPIDPATFQGFTFRIIKIEPIINLSSIFGPTQKVVEEAKPQEQLAYLKE